MSKVFWSIDSVPEQTVAKTFTENMFKELYALIPLRIV